MSLSTAAVLDRPATSRPAAAAPTPRCDLYAPIHKALRLFMTDTLARLGRLDTADRDESRAMLAQLDALLDLCTSHLQHENDFLHPALEARQRHAAARTALDHIEHGHGIAALRAEAQGLREAPAVRAPALALRLYRQLALFVANNLQHMHVEETANNAALWEHYSDEELRALHDRLLATLSDAERLQVARWMIPALSPAERAAVLGAMRAQMPPEAFRTVLDAVQPHVDHAGWIKLTQALRISPVPGLVEIG